MRSSLFVSVGLVFGLLPGTRAATVPVDFARDVAPILRAYCAGCHDDARREGRLSVETYARLRAGGEDRGDPIRPGQPDASFFMRSLEGRDSPKMPPKDEPRVPAAELATLRRWIEEGAPGPEPTRDVSILSDLAVPRIPPAAGPVAYSAAAYSRDGRRLALGRFGEFEVWDTTHQALLRKIQGLPGKVNGLHFSPDGTRVVAATGVTGLSGVALVYEVATGDRVLALAGHSDALYDAEYSPDGTRLATAGYDRVVRLWTTGDGALVRAIDVHKGAIFDLAWHPSGSILASASADETVKLWRVADGVRLDTLNQPQGEVRSVHFTADGEHVLAAGADKRIYLWRLTSREVPGLNPVIHSRFAHESAIHALAVSADGRYVLSSADDRTVKLWSLPDLRLLHAYPTQPEIAASVVGIPGTERFLMARMDGRTEAIPVVASLSAPISGPEKVGNPAAVGPNAATVPTSTANLVPREAMEAEPNDLASEAKPVEVPAEVSGRIGRPGDTDHYRFAAEAGKDVLLEVTAARSKSKLDSRIEILHPDGSPVEQVVLQAVRDSWFTFRGKDSESPDDFRLHNWAEMELDEYFYANGEVIRLWLYPRGPDSGFKVYPGEGRRHTYFGTTALAHAVGEPGFVVVPLPAGSRPAPNGLPVFRLDYVNDDDPTRRNGTDSLLIFSPPRDGEYVVRVSDVRGFGGEQDFSYRLSVRSPRPGFKVTLSGTGAKVSPGSARELTFKAERWEGFDGPIRIEIGKLPPGFGSSSPIEIEAGQSTAVGILHAEIGSADPDEAADRAVTVSAFATIAGQEVRQDLGTLGDLQLGPPPKVTLEILPSSERSYVTELAGRPLEFAMRPGETIQARVRAVRHDFTGRIELGNEDSGRNLPHGVYVDNIGLNGLLIVEGQTEREFFVTASKIVRPCRRLFHLRARVDDGQASKPVIVNVLPSNAADVAASR